MSDHYLAPHIRALHDAIADGMIDRKKLIAGGWILHQRYVLPKDSTPEQIAEVRLAFIGGAQHIFASIMSVMDPGTEPTEADLQRMDNILRELSRELAARTVRRPKGSA